MAAFYTMPRPQQQSKLAANQRTSKDSQEPKPLTEVRVVCAAGCARTSFHSAVGFSFLRSRKLAERLRVAGAGDGALPYGVGVCVCW